MKKLTAQKPAQGILQTHAFGDSMHYAITCECGHPDDMIDFSIELEADDYNIVLNTEFTPRIAYWERLISDCSSFENPWLYSIDGSIRGIINHLYFKVRMTYDIWFTGHIKYHQTTVMTEQQALNYAAIINQSIKDLRKFREKENHD
jgi:hypothetical protein